MKYTVGTCGWVCDESYNRSDKIRVDGEEKPEPEIVEAPGFWESALTAVDYGRGQFPRLLRNPTPQSFRMPRGPWLSEKFNVELPITAAPKLAPGPHETDVRSATQFAPKISLGNLNYCQFVTNLDDV